MALPRSALPALLLALVWVALVVRVGPPHGDFANYYTASALVLEGAPAERFYDYRWFTEQAARLGFGDQLVGFAVLTPPSALLAIPVVPLGPEGAARAWQVLQGVLLFGLLGATAWALRLRAWVAFAAAFLVWPAIASHLAQGQVHLLAALSVALGMGWYDRRRDGWAGLAWGLAVGLKVHAWPLLALALVTRRWRAFGTGVGTLVAGAVASVALLGWPIHAAYLGEIGPRAARGFFTHPWSVTLQSFGHLLRHLFLAHPGLNPTPALDLPVLAAGLPPTLELAAVGATLAVATRKDAPLFRCLAAAALVAMVTGSILARYHLVLAFPALLVGVLGLQNERPRAALFGLALSLAAWVPIPADWAPGVLAILSVPRFWLLFLAWALVVPWHRRAAWGAGIGLLLSLPSWFPGDATDDRPEEAPGLPLVTADLLCTGDDTLWFSGMPSAPPFDHWVGYRWPLAGWPEVAERREAHVWGPHLTPEGTVAWGGPARDEGPVPCGDRVYFLSDEGVGVRADRIRSRPR